MVRDSTANAQGKFGDGLVVVAELGPTEVNVTATRIEQSVLAALASWGADSAVGASVLRCQAFDLDSETYGGTPR